MFRSSDSAEKQPGEQKHWLRRRGAKGLVQWWQAIGMAGVTYHQGEALATNVGRQLDRFRSPLAGKVA